MVLTCLEMRALEERAFADGIAAEELMEQAGAGIARAVSQFFPLPGRCLVFFGKGHNGGDALVAARHLVLAGWNVELRPAFPQEQWSVLTRKNFEHFDAQPPGQGGSSALVVLDGLLGIGAGGPLREPIASAVRAIHELRRNENAQVFALDLPTGLDGDSGAADPLTIEADFTLTIGFAKSGILDDRATHFVGRLGIIPLEALSARADSQPCNEIVATGCSLKSLLPRRPFDTHKGHYGRIAVLAGSVGLTGAAVMTASAALHAGGGLITLYVHESCSALVAAAAPPEVMVKPVHTYLELLDAHFDVLALGPGLGQERHAQICELIARVPQPMVIDADALNALAPTIGILETCRGPRLLTPHPGEMARLDPGSPQRSRRETLNAFTARYTHTLLLKGARTLVGQRGQALSYNSTGSPGMATGGMGDVLTGVCAALAGQKLGLFESARLAAWLCGRAAELAISLGGQSEESLSATGLFAHLGQAFKELRSGSV